MTTPAPIERTLAAVDTSLNNRTSTAAWRNVAIFSAAVAISLMPVNVRAGAREVFQQASPNIFSVETVGAAGKPLRQGSGVRISRDSLITNCHVLDEAKGITVRQENRRFPGKVVQRDEGRDLCLVSVSFNDAQKAALKLRDSETLVVGEEVFAIGAPLGLELTISNGIVSSLRKAEDGMLIQITAPISPGSSGGGLFDGKGNLIGITTLQAVEGQNVNFAIPVEWIKQIHQRSAERELIERAAKEFQARANTLKNAKQWSELEVFTSRQLKVNTKNRLALAYLAVAQTGLGRLDEALQSFEQFIKLPVRRSSDVIDDLMVSIPLGHALDKSGRVKEAIEVLAVSVYVLPTRETMGNLLTRIVDTSGWVAGEKIYRRATEIYPESSIAFEYLGRTLVNLRRHPEAVLAFRRSVGIDPENEPSWVWLLFVHRLTDDKRAFESAFQALQRAASPATVNGVVNSLEKLFSAR